MAVITHSAVEVSLPLRTRSTLNAREHWRERAARTREQRAVVRMRLGTVRLPLPAKVTLTRVGPRALDGDNLQGALKAVRDGVSDALGVDDGSDAVTWIYGQERGGYAVRIRVETRRSRS